MSLALTDHYQTPVLDCWQRHRQLLINQISQANRFTPDAAILVDQYLAQPGKLLRPILLLTGYSLNNDQPNEDIIDLAISLEFLHIYLLIHDDIMDQSDLRRGSASLHKLFEKFHQENHLSGDSIRYGENMAILIGDYISNYAEHIWTEKIEKNPEFNVARQKFDQLKEKVYWGQYLDIAVSSTADMPNIDDLLEVMREKTSRYSLEDPLTIGQLLAGEKPNPDIANYAQNLGIVFQLIDDILGSFGDPKVTGKSDLADIIERKRTALVYYSLESTSPETEILKNYYLGKTNIEAQKIRQIIEDNGGVAKTRNLAQKYYHQAIAALNKAKISENQKQELTDFAFYLLNRVK